MAPAGRLWPLNPQTAREGLTAVLIEHDMTVVFSLADRVVVMHQGRIIADGASAAVRDDPGVKEAYLGQ